MKILTFEANLDDSRPWGGKYISRLKGIRSDSIIGESWEVSANPHSPGICEQNELKNSTLIEISKQHSEELLGPISLEKYGSQFPLLLKLLDAEDNLSVQVHPPTDYAKEHHGDRFGKEEAWYILPESEGGCIYLGLQEGVEMKNFEAMVRSGYDFKLEDVMNKIMVKPGEVYWLKTGTLHALGKGTKVLEIQRDSDRTYRVYDYNRPGKDGEKRELHVDHAFAVIDDSLRGKNCIDQLRCQPTELAAGDLNHLPSSSEHFQIRSLNMSPGQVKDIQTQNRFVTVTAFEDIKIKTEEEFLELKMGYSALIPAQIDSFQLFFPRGGLALLTTLP